MSLYVSYMVAGCLSLSLWSSGVPACLSLSLMIAVCLSLYGCWLSLTVFYMVADSLSQFPICLLVVPHRLSGPIELLHVSPCLLLLQHWLSLPVSLVLWSCCMSLTVIAGCPSLSSIWLLAVSYCLLYVCWLSLTVSSVVAGCLSLSLWSNGVAACLSLSLVEAGCLSLSPIWLLAVS